MAFIPVPFCIELQLIQRLDNQRIENTLYFGYVAEITEEVLQALGDAAFVWWDEHIAPELSQELSLIEAIVTDLTSDTAPSVTRVPGSPIAGERVQPSEPNNVSICVSFRTSGRGRSSRGRNYLSGLGTGDVTGNEFDQNLLDNLVDGYAILISEPLIEGSVWAVVSRFHDKAPRVNGIYEPITAVIAVDNIVDSQRRRLPGRGQ